MNTVCRRTHITYVNHIVIVPQEYFSLDIKPIQDRCSVLKGVTHLRLGIHDFDPFNLRLRLPDVIKELAIAHAETSRTVYIHCTAGALRPLPFSHRD